MKRLRFFDHHKRVPPATMLDRLADSRAVLSLQGDTASTDRDHAVFETMSLKVELESNAEGLMKDLPFADDVPWRDLIVWVNRRSRRTVAEDVLARLGDMSEEEWNRRVEEMRRRRLDVLWTLPGSRAHKNVLRAAVAAQKNWPKKVHAEIVEREKAKEREEEKERGEERDWRAEQNARRREYEERQRKERSKRNVPQKRMSAAKRRANGAPWVGHARRAVPLKELRARSQLRARRIRRGQGLFSRHTGGIDT